MDAPGTTSTRHPRRRTLLITVGAVVLAFLVGALWQYLDARAYRSERDALERELLFQELATTLAGAIIQTDNGGFESARALASDFFTTLQTNLGRAPEGAAGAFQDILSRRDATITALSRNDPGAEELLTRMFVRYQVATGGPEVAVPLPQATPPRPDTSAGAVPPGDTIGGPDGS